MAKPIHKAAPVKPVSKNLGQKPSGKSFSVKLPNSQNKEMLYDKSNYLLMVVGVVFIIVGFMLMSGGNSGDPNKFIPEEIYSARRITLAPIVIVLGFIIEIVAILKKPSVA